MLSMLALLLAVARSDGAAGFQPVFSNLQNTDIPNGHFNTDPHDYGHHTHEAPEEPVFEEHPHDYIVIPIIKDCVGDMNPEANKCVCSAYELGFAQNTCEEGQACFPDGSCQEMEDVTCAVMGATDLYSPDFVGTVTYNGQAIPVGTTRRFYFTDAGASAEVSIGLPSEGCAAFPDVPISVKCTAASGPWRSMSFVWDVNSSDNWTLRGDAIGANQQCVNGRSTLFISPYIRASPATCLSAQSEAQCNNMRAVGARCCFDFASAKCSYDEQCFYNAGPVGVNPRNFMQQIFGDNLVEVNDDTMGSNNMRRDGLLMSVAKTISKLVM